MSICFAVHIVFGRVFERKVSDGNFWHWRRIWQAGFSHLSMKVSLYTTYSINHNRNLLYRRTEYFGRDERLVAVTTAPNSFVIGLSDNPIPPYDPPPTNSMHSLF